MEVKLPIQLGLSESPIFIVPILKFGTSINPLEELMSHIMDIDKKWLSLELAYNITPTHRLSLMYGSQRGGLVCSNGICRIIPPFNDGFRINLTSMF